MYEMITSTDVNIKLTEPTNLLYYYMTVTSMCTHYMYMYMTMY